MLEVKSLEMSLCHLCQCVTCHKLYKNGKNAIFDTEMIHDTLTQVTQTTPCAPMRSGILQWHYLVCKVIICSRQTPHWLKRKSRMLFDVSALSLFSIKYC